MNAFSSLLLSTQARAQAPTVAQAPEKSSLISNGKPEEIAAVKNLFAALQKTLAARDANTLKLVGISDETQENFAPQLRLTHLAMTETGALARYEYSAESAKKITNSTEPKIVRELWLERRTASADNAASGNVTFVPSDAHWNAPEDAARRLLESANASWKDVPAPQESTDARAANESSSIIDLVALWRGGRWIPLRVSRVWQGALLDRSRLRQTEQKMLDENDARLPGSDANESRFAGSTRVHASTSPDDETLSTRAALPWDFSPWLRRQMKRYENEESGTAHFLLQSGRRGWVGLDSAWEAMRNQTSAQLDADKAAHRLRESLEKEAYLSPVAHRDFASALFKLGLYEESADAFQKAEKLKPESVGAGQLREAEKARENDPQKIALAQVQHEAQVGLDAEHPSNTIPKLQDEVRNSRSPLPALRLGLEYSRLAADEQADEMLRYARSLWPQFVLSPDDNAWAVLLSQQLDERREMASRKPPTTIRSTLFTVRCWPNNLSAVRLLAGLEAAQHTIYADFGVPMSNTEVILWRNQSEFQSYTTKMTGNNTSEFVTALTLTQLVNSGNSPKVLGEEMVFYIGKDADTISTIAHEYGHIAVRLLSRGRAVPDWLNEGIAASVEGGYKDGIERVRNAARADALLSMDELRRWNVDGERAFLAYSQANSMIDFIKARWGEKYLLNILRNIGQDSTPDNAVRHSLGISTDDLWKQWRNEGIR